MNAYYCREANAWICRDCNHNTDECRCLKASEGPWVAWFDRDETGRIVTAGVDNEGRGANICLVTTENIEAEDVELFNRWVIGETLLLAAAWEMRELLAICESYVPVGLQRDIQALRERTTKFTPQCLENGPYSEVP